MITLTRREVLRIAVLAGGALRLVPRRAMASRPKQFRPNVFISIDEKGIVELTIPRPEMGQGVRTGIAVLLADELGASLEQLRLRQADFDPVYGDQYVGGSSSMPGSWAPLRTAGAAAREMLVLAAALRAAATTGAMSNAASEVTKKKRSQRGASSVDLIGSIIIYLLASSSVLWVRLAGTRPSSLSSRMPSGESTKSANSNAACGCGALAASASACGRPTSGSIGRQSIGPPLLLIESALPL